MHCLDCAVQSGSQAVAFGCCRHCGAAVCLDHATIVTPVAGAIGMMPASSARRVISCLDCTPRPHSLARTSGHLRLVEQRTPEALV